MTRQTGANRASERSNRQESLTRGTGEDGGVEADALRDSAGGEVTVSGVIQSYRGPLPPPAAFQAYETTLPGAADRILGLTEKQQDHRHRVEPQEQDRANQWQELAMRDRAQARGMVFVLALALLAGGVGC